MAQYWEDWSGSTVGAEPTGWTKRFVTSGTVYKVEADASGYAPANRRLLIDKSATDRAAISFDAVSSVADVQIRILARCFASAEITTQYAGPAGRIAGAAASETVVAGNFASKTTTETTQIVQINAGTISPLKYGDSLSWATTGYYWITLTLSSGTATVTIADVATPETVIETISNAVAVTDAGLVGLFASNAVAVVHVLAVGVGTGSDTAPYSDPFTTVPTMTGSVTFASITQTGYTAQWSAGSDNVAVTGYEYQIGGTGGSWTDAGNNLSVAITGRTSGATETVYVRAYDAAGNRSTPAIRGEVTVLAATVTVTDPLKNNAGTLLASQSGVKAAVLQVADLASVYEATGLTTNASGVLSAISNAAITTGSQYHVVIKLADGSVGITGPITAS